MTPEFLSEERLRQYTEEINAQVSPTLWVDVISMAKELLWRRAAWTAVMRIAHPLIQSDVFETVAKLYATQHPQKLQAGCEHFQGHCKCDPPHHLRCDFVDDDFRRCTLGNGEHTEHKFRKEQAT
jgi:hypothetical protein